MTQVECAKSTLKWMHSPKHLLWLRYPPRTNFWFCLDVASLGGFACNHKRISFPSLEVAHNLLSRVISLTATRESSPEAMHLNLL